MNKDYNKSILRVDDTVETAIHCLNSQRLGIIMVSNDKNSLIGTVTDGDIRRGLLRHITITSHLGEIMHKDCFFATEKDSRERIISMMNKEEILQVPIIDDRGVIVGVETLQHLLENKIHDNAVLISAGGFGARLRPLTNDTPKPMLNMGGKPILEIIINNFIKHGFYDFYISVHYKAELIKAYFGNGDDWNVDIKYLHEDEPLGTAGALGLLPTDIHDSSIIVMNSDILTDIDLEEFVRYHDNKNCAATICVREYDIKVPFGVVEPENDKVSSIVEKPVHNFFVNAGIYALDHNIVKNIKKNKNMDMPDFLNSLIENGKHVEMFPIHEYWLDIGQAAQYEQGQQDILNKKICNLDSYNKRKS